MFNESMVGDGGSQPGDHELALAGGSAIWAVAGWLVAELSSGLRSPTGLSLTFLLWLFTLLAATRAAVALTIGISRRRRHRR